MTEKYEVMGNRPFVQVPVIDERPAECSLDALDALVYGYLVHLARKDNGSSRTKIATTLRLDKKAVDRAVSILIAGGAVIEDGRTIKAVKPAGASRAWFRYLKEPTRPEWYERFVYDRVYLPRSSTAISVKTNLLYWHLVKLGEPVYGMPGCLKVGGDPDGHPPYLTIEYLAQAIRAYRKTVSRSMRALQELGLVRVQFTSRRKFVCGLPPIGTNASLWRDSWSPTGGAVEVANVTAESLFGVPSSSTLKADTRYDAGVGRYMRSYGIRGEVAEKIVTKIVKHRIERQEWQPILKKVHHDHERNKVDMPGKYKVEHCGHLFHHDLEKYVLTRQARLAVHGDPSPSSGYEMQARGMLADLRVPREMYALLNYALASESLEVQGGRSVPCMLHWENVLAVLNETKGDFRAFKQGVAKAIGLKAGNPRCEWYESWMRMEQIPTYDPSPMVMLGVDRKSRDNIRTHATFIAEQKVGKDDTVWVTHLVNDLIRLGCWQARGKSESDVRDGINEIKKVLFRTKETEEEMMKAESKMDDWRRALEGVSVW